MELVNHRQLLAKTAYRSASFLGAKSGERRNNTMPTSSIFTNVKITDPKKAEAFVNALDKAANTPYERKERGESHILTDHEEIRKLMEKRRNVLSNS